MAVRRRPSTARMTGAWNTLPARPNPTRPTVSMRGDCTRGAEVRYGGPHPLAAWSWRATLLRSLLGPHPLAAWSWQATLLRSLLGPHPLAAWSWRATLLRSLLGPHPLAPSPFGRGGTA